MNNIDFKKIEYQVNDIDKHTYFKCTEKAKNIFNNFTFHLCNYLKLRKNNINHQFKYIQHKNKY